MMAQTSTSAGMGVTALIRLNVPVILSETKDLLFWRFFAIAQNGGKALPRMTAA